MPTTPPVEIYTLQCELLYTDPAIWRELEVEGDSTLADLHDWLQAAFGWEDAHMHQFTMPPAGAPKRNRDNPYNNDPGARQWGPPYADLDHSMADEQTARINEVLTGVKQRLLYLYDFGDDWTHAITVRKIQPADPAAAYPRCIAGGGKSALDDSGGPFGWSEKFAAASDPRHEEYDEIRAWMGLKKGEPFDPQAFDMNAVNRQITPKPKKSAGRRWPADKAPPVPGNVRLVTYNVVSHPIVDPRLDFPKAIARRESELGAMAQSQPKKAIPILRELLAQYPDTPRIGNFLMIAYARAKQAEDLHRQIADNYRRSPWYLFAMTNYATLQLDRGDLDGARETLGQKWDLSLHYPERTEFHFSEVSAFQQVVGRYFAQAHEYEPALVCLELLYSIDPEAPGTLFLESLLMPFIAATLATEKKSKTKGKGKRKKKR